MTPFKRSLCFVTILLLAYAAMELTARAIFPTKTNVMAVSEAWKRAAPEIEILFMGNSHMGATINCRFIGIPCFNAAIGSQDLVRTAKTFAQHLPQAPRLKFLVVELSYISFGVDTDVDAPYMAADYIEAFDIWPAPGNYVRTLLDFSALFFYRDSLFPALWNRLTGGRREHVTFDIVEGGERAGETHSRVYGKVLTPNFAALGEMLDRAKGAGLQVVLITVPVTPYYWRAYERGAKQLFYETVRRVVQKHPVAAYLDFSRWDGLVDGDWGDPGHLNWSGSRKFTTFFNDVYLPLIVRRYLASNR